jgi:hypothetical protein
MSPANDSPASCDICDVICFICGINMSAAEIHCELCVAYGHDVIREGNVRQWCRMFKDG